MTGSAARSEHTPTHGAPRDAAAPSAVGACAASECAVWGVLNVTPDSFSDGGRFLSHDDALAHGRAMVREGASVIDVGGESSRPRGATYGAGAEEVSADEELRRVLPVVRALVADGIRVSVDTVEAEVADACLASGARVVNDVSMGRSDRLLSVCAAHGAELVLMHTRGRGEVSPPATVYRDVALDVREELLAAVDRATRFGVAPERIWLDPGLGFAKTAAQSGAVLAATGELVRTGLRVLVGASRKSFVGALAALEGQAAPPPDARLPGSLAAAVLAAVSGAHAVRVHDVAPTSQALRFTHAITGGTPWR